LFYQTWTIAVSGADATTVESLKARIAALERRPLLNDAPESVAKLPVLPGILDLAAAPGGLLHEVFSSEQRNSGAALGFTFGLARPLLTPSRPALIYLQLTADTQEMGFPYAMGFASFGVGADQIVLGRVDTLTELLWAMEEAIACKAVAAVIADIAQEHEMLDFKVSRRLSLRAAAARTSAFMLRYGSGREASAAKLRWRVMPAVSMEVEFDPLAPGPPRYSVTLEKSRLGAAAQRLEGQSFELDWVDHGFVVVERGRRERVIVQRKAAPSRALPSALGNRLHKAG
jgi:protein ImuA